MKCVRPLLACTLCFCSCCFRAGAASRFIFVKADTLSAPSVLSDSSTVIQPVTVEASSGSIYNLGSLTTVTVKGSYLENLPSVGAVLDRLPGVHAGEEEITVAGKGSAAVLIDDKPVVSLAELNALQPDWIYSIVVDRNPSAAEDSRYNAVIRIRTIRKRSGALLYNDLRAGRLLSDRAGIYFSHNIRKLAFSAGYDFSARNRKDYSNTSETDCSDASAATLNRYRDTLTAKRRSHRFYADIGYDLGDRNRLRLNYTYYTSGNRPLYKAAAAYSSEGRTDSALISKSGTYRVDEHSIGLKYDYDSRLGWKFRLIADYYRRRVENDQVVNESGRQRYSIERRFDERFDIGSFLAETEHKWGTYSFSAGLKYVVVDNGSHSRHCNDDIVEFKRLTENEMNGAVYASLNGVLGRFSFDAAMRGEFYRRKYKSGSSPLLSLTQYEWLPSLNLRYDFSNRLRLSLYGNKKVVLPSFNALNPDITVLNTRSYIQGDPFLHPMHTVTAGVACDLFRSIHISADYVYYKNRFADAAILDSVGLIRYTTVNIAKSGSWNFRVAYDNEWGAYGLSVEGMVGLPHAEIPFMGGTLDSSKPVYSLSINQRVSFCRGFDFYLDFGYTSKVHELPTVSTPTYDLSAGISYTYRRRNHRATVTVYAEDLLGRSGSDWTTRYGRVSNSQINDYDSRFFGVSVRYRFNVPDRAAQRRSNEPELDRLR